MRRTILVALAFLLTGCGGEKASLGDDRLGHWVIVGHRMPGVSAMTEDRAAAWHGKAVDLTEAYATAGPDTCWSPEYRDRTVPADSLLTTGYHVAPGSLGPLLPPGGTVRITVITCEGETWFSPGAFLIWTSPKTALTPWEGVFFELERR